ncbi:MAG: hypothetical protein OWQ57_05910 [Sulfobacillus sp.]|nr:hypothetical protein [Sulfobacillus sp.]
MTMDSFARWMRRVMGWLVVVAVVKAAWVFGHAWLAAPVQAALGGLPGGGLWITNPAAALQNVLASSPLGQLP